MWYQHLTRRRLLVLGGTAVAAKLCGVSLGQVSVANSIRIGAVFPTKTGEMAIRTSIYDVIGEAARMGAILAGDELGTQADPLGMRLEVLLASSPNADAAFRAGQRLVATEGVSALIGGLGEGQAEALSAVANEHRIPFFNIGSPSAALRGEICSRYTFHVEASAAMYLDALADWFAESDHRRWFVIYEDSGEGAALHDRAVKAITQHQAGGEVVGAAAVVPEQPVYTAEVEAIRRADADVVLLLLDPLDQIPFLAQSESMGLDVPMAPFPDPVTQTRDYFATARYQAPRVGPGHRIVLWETTLEANGAGELNDHFMARWGEPVNPTAWAAYQAVKIFYNAVVSTGTLEGSVLVDYLESPEAVFDVQKGTGVSFRSWDHQLRQPLYVVNIDPEAEWGPELTRRVELVDLVGELPAAPTSDILPAERLDLLGDGPGESDCYFE